MELNKQQQKAVEMAVEQSNCIIAGGAGTGKTTIIKQIIESLPRGYVYLAAPTGKAAARMKECTGYYAETIHRLIGLTEEGIHLGGKSLAGKAVIIDEASMIDSWLMARLISENPQRIILIGDEAQLPPVGAGSPFHDLLRLVPESTTRLTHCYRSSSSVHFAAQRIRSGIIPENSESGGEKYEFRQMPAELAQQQIIRMFEAGELNPNADKSKERLGDIVLASMYGEDDAPGGINSLNKAIMAVVNPHTSGQKWKVGDRVLNCKNFGDKDWWNGDMGTIIDVDSAGKSVEIQPDRARDEGSIYITQTEMLRELKHAWALSVHKAQGSQWDKVVFLAPPQHSFMLTRPMIYTAVTRTKKECLVMGDKMTFFNGLQKLCVKHTCLKLIAEKELIGL